MDGALLLGLVAVLVVLNTIAVGGLLVLTLRDRRPGGGAPAVAPRAAAAPGSTDPLADAITAFLDRPDGLFRTGSAGRAVAPPTMPAAGPVDAAPVAPEPRRPATTPPSRLVTSGAPIGAEPAAPWAGAPRPGPSFVPPPAAGVRYSDRRPAMRLEVGLVARDARSAAASDAAVRLGPVIGGLLRERTRADDIVLANGPGRFAAILPESSRSGAAALAVRLESGCDAWLAAELPPLRLDLAIAEQPGGLPPAPATPSRVGDPDRRRSIRSAT